MYATKPDTATKTIKKNGKLLTIIPVGTVVSFVLVYVVLFLPSPTSTSF